MIDYGLCLWEGGLVDRDKGCFPEGVRAARERKGPSWLGSAFY